MKKVKLFEFVGRSFVFAMSLSALVVATAAFRANDNADKDLSAKLTEKEWVFLIGAAQEKSYKDAAPVLEKLIPQLQIQLKDTTTKK